METRPPRIPALTGLRVLAAAVVVLYHYRMIAMRHGAPLSSASVINIIAQGHLGVSFFFLLSGFTLLYTYGGFDQPGALNRWSFWRARVARIYPLYLIGVIVGAIPYFWYFSGTAPGTLTVFILTLALMQSWLPSASNTLNSPGWSLSDEAFFYGLFPWIRYHALKAPTRVLCLALLLCWGTLAAAPAVLALLVHGDPSGGDFHNFLTREPPMRLPEFVAGVILAVVYVRRRAWRRPRVDRTRWKGEVATWGTVAVTLLVLALPLVPVLPSYWGAYMVTDPLFAVLIYTLVWHDSTLSRLLALYPLQVLGEASYAMYILHLPVLYILDRVWAHWSANPAASPLFLPCYLAIVLLLSLYCFLRIERPARQVILGRRRSGTVRESRRGAQRSGARVLKGELAD